jgi:hypothetical protein
VNYPRLPKTRPCFLLEVPKDCCRKGGVYEKRRATMSVVHLAGCSRFLLWTKNKKGREGEDGKSLKKNERLLFFFSHIIALN